MPNSITYDGPIHNFAKAVAWVQDKHFVQANLLAAQFQVTPDLARKWLGIMHLEGLIYIDSWERGAKPARKYIPWYAWQDPNKITRADAEKPKDTLSRR